MGRKIPIFSFLCGVLTRKKPAPAEEATKPKPDDTSDSSATQSPEKRISTSSAPETLEAAAAQPLPPPPGTGRGHMRTVSCQHHRSNSVSRLVSTLSMRVIGGIGATAAREEKGEKKEHHHHHKGAAAKMFKHEDSIWKKTIILGEKCRVPDEDEADILYDEKGNKFSTYHPKTHSGVLQFSKQTSCIDDHNQLSKK